MNVGLMLKMNIYLISVIMHFGWELWSIISTFHTNKLKSTLIGNLIVSIWIKKISLL